MDEELSQRKRTLKKVAKEKKPAVYDLQFTPAEYVNQLMRSHWSPEYLIAHKMTSEASKRGVSKKKAMPSRERHILLSKYLFHEDSLTAF